MSSIEEQISVYEVEPATSSEVVALAQSFALAHGFPYFAVTGRFKKNGRRYATAILSNYPREFINLYQSSGWGASDPALERAYATVEPFSWDSLKVKTRPQRRQKAAALKYGLADGFTVSLHGPEGEGIALFIGGREPPQASSERKRLAAECWSFLVQLYGPLERLLRPSGPVRKLTRRERQVLTLMAAGMKPSEIFEYLGISSRSVSLAINAAILKLRASSREQALIIALASGEISWVAPAPTPEVDYLIGF